MQFKEAVEEAHIAADDQTREGITQEASANQDAGRQLPDPALGQQNEETEANQEAGRQLPDPGKQPQAEPMVDDVVAQAAAKAEKTAK